MTFPDQIKSHTREQISCFGPDGLLRRQEYTVDIPGGAPELNYATDYREVDGIIIPTTRRIYAWEADYQRVPEPRLVRRTLPAAECASHLKGLADETEVFRVTSRTGVPF